MKLVWLLPFLILAAAAAPSTLLLMDFSLFSHQNVVWFLSGHDLFLFSVFQVLIFAILTTSYDRPPNDVFEGFLPDVQFNYVAEEEEEEKEEEEEEEEIRANNVNACGDKSSHCGSNPGTGDCYEDDDHKDIDYYDSDGYNEDDDDDSSDDLVGWDDDDEEIDDDLDGRIERFIAKVVAGWKEEMLREIS